MATDTVVFEEKVLLCSECYKQSGLGIAVAIRYSNTGGWSPAWEGRLCSHLTPADALAYYKR